MPKRPLRADSDAERRDWAIEALVPGGDGMAVLADGRVAFATGAVPGDVIRPLGVEARKGSVRATRWELVTKGTDRVSPPCPVADACGGCDWMHLALSAQRAHKARLLRDALTRTGGIRGLPEEIPVHATGEALGYRSRTRFHIDAQGRIGLLQRGAHAVVSVPACPVSHADINGALEILRRLPTSVWMEFSELEIRVAKEAPPSVLLRERVTGAVSKPARRALSGVTGLRFSIAGESAGTADRFEVARGTHVTAPPGVFTQVNEAVNRRLVQAVLEGAQARAVKRFCDAYSGAGNFSLPLLALGLSGISIERDARAVDAAREAASEQGLPAGGFVCGAVKEALGKLAAASERFDLLLLDPPRSGAAEAIAAIARLRPDHIAYVACDPVTLARDVRSLAGAGYRLGAVEGFDMFPHTHHLETLAWLSANASPA